MRNSWAATASILAMISVVLGAMASHYLKDKIPMESIQNFKLASQYMLVHSIALLAISLKFSSELKQIKYLFLVGMLFFSGSIFVLSTRTLTGLSFLKPIGVITPVGGVLLILAWLLLGLSFLKKKTNP